MKPSRHIDHLLEIMAALRNPETGCPWDIIQTFRSILPYTIEEVYEVADAINRDDRIDLCEELGDLLLQVIYYARLAEEEGSFDFGDVVEAITAKMIRRHPHVFGTKAERKAGMQKDAWEKIKAQEKAEHNARKQATGGLPVDKSQSCLNAVRPSLPAHLEALKLQQLAAKTGFDWPDATAVLQKLTEETEELTEAMKTGKQHDIAAEYGDLFFTVINLGRKLVLDQEAALAMTNRKFRQRFAYIEQEAKKHGKKTGDLSLAEMEQLWVEAKKD